ncbi:MAG TPA: methyltransferase domain-containing protein [Azospirillum sp.]|nr:methyltransferase domain-containing protein [Azospirillum sp.]
MRQFQALFDVRDTDRIIDIGGGVFNWRLIDRTPSVVMVNIAADEKGRVNGRFWKVKGDGRDLPYSDNSFDIAYSNSVIEHVGGWDDQMRFAAEVRRMAPRYYVQTPNRRFVVEPHLMAPFIHFLPRRVLRRLVRYASVWGWVVRPKQAEVDRVLDGITLLDEGQMRRLFPDAVILRERFAGMTKSIIAVRLG